VGRVGAVSDPLAVIAELPGVPEAVKEAREAVDRLYRHRVLRRRSPEVSAESALRGARASAALEGVDVPLGSLRAGEVADPVVQGALRASAEVGRLGSAWRTAPRQALARLHAVAAAGLVPEPALGRPRADEAGREDVAGPAAAGGPAATPTGRPDAGDARSVAGEDRLEAGRGASVAGSAETGAAVSAGSAHASVPADPLGLGLGPAPGAEVTAVRMDALARLVTGPSAIASALVTAAIVHAELMVLRPFGSADGLVARAAERLTLVEFGLDPKALAIVEMGHLDLGAAYAESLRAYLTGTPDGVATWVRHCAAAVTLGVRETRAVCEALERG
jgi:hypothetical protein